MPFPVEDLPGWTFEIQELSSHSYEVIGFDREGHWIHERGADVDVLIVEVRGAAKKLAQKATRGTPAEKRIV
jgi:hypothetical protein